MLKLISWNLAGRVQRVVAQCAYLANRKTDIVAFQEVSKRTLPILHKLLAAQGLKYITDSFALRSYPSRLKGPRRYGEIIATRWPIHHFKRQVFDPPWPERILSAVIDTPYGRIDLHTAHVPVGSNHGWKKIRTLEAIYDGLSIKSKHLRILCGDFNTPQEERDDGRIITWAERENRKGNIVFIPSRGVRWDQGERRVLSGLKNFNLPDVFRHLHKYKVKQFSWVSRKRGRRYDHVFASIELNPIECRYLHFARKNGLSDHSPIEACFQPNLRKSGYMRMDARKMKPICPLCRSGEIIPIVYGLPGPELGKKSNKGKVILGGCMVWEGHPQSHCNDCGYEWRGNGTTFKGRKNGKKPFDDFRNISRRFKHELDEPLSLQLMARLRMAGSLNDEDWAEILEHMTDAIEFLAVENRKSSRNYINLYGDPRNREWLRIINTNKLAGYKLPHWAALWLRRIGITRKGKFFWRSVGKVASEMGFEKIR